MRIRVLFFGILKDVIGRAADSREVESGSDISRLFDLYAGLFPDLRRHRESLLFSRNQEFVGPNQCLQEGDEVAFLPPVSGGVDDQNELSPNSGQDKLICVLTRNRLDAAFLVSQLQRPEAGAVVVFEGVVRNHSQGRPTRYLEYEAYEPMALKKMREIGGELMVRFPIDRVGLLHRLGRLEIGEASVVIVVTSAHRKAAFDACHKAIDQLKRIVPIWKKEFFADGAVWVEGEKQQAGFLSR